jgi:hypothetical protein
MTHRIAFLTALIFSCAFTAAAADTDGWIDLFNGKDLTGWNTTGNWIIHDDGVIEIRPKDGQKGWKRFSDYLTTKEKYKDFILSVEYNYPKGGNSGVYFRINDPKNPVSTGIECQVLDSSHKGDTLTAHDHGGIIKTQAPTKNMSKKPGEWNKMVITAKGHHLQVVLNGEQIIDIQLDKTPVKDRPGEGHISLQDHGQPHNIKFRNIRLKKLD